jgi:hypothetical protein
MKNLVTILTVTLILGFTATPAKANSEKLCGWFTQTVTAMAKARDAGLSAEDSYYVLVENGFGEELSLQLLEIVYLTFKDLEPSQLGNLSLNLCKSETS